MRQEKSSVNFEKFTKSFGRKQAQLRQVITKSYPSSTGGKNDYQDNLVPEDDFDSGNSYDENRLVWLPVPESYTEENVKSILEKNPDACIYKVLSSQPIMTSSDLSYINSLSAKDAEEVTEKIIQRQLVHDTDGNLIKDEYDRMIYRKLFFSKTEKSDKDLRESPIKREPSRQKEKNISEKNFSF